MQTITREYLDSNVTEQQSRGRKCICPACSGHNLWDTTLENGLAFCFECEASYRVNDDLVGSWEPVKPHPNIEGIREYYEAISRMYHGFVEQEHRSFLSNRGITDGVIETFNIGFCPESRLSIYDHPLAYDSGVARKNDKMPFLGGRITFPFYGEGKVTDLRGRVYKNNKEVKYKGLFFASARRGALYPFNFDRAYAKAQEKKYIIITEGEIKAILADMYGFPCVGLPGMVSWRSMSLPPEWKVIAIFDNSKHALDRMRIDKALDRVYTKIPSIQIGTLPLEKEDKQDIDSFFLGKGDRVKWFQEIVDNSLSYQTYKQYRRF
jgi:hypothetical protein